MQQFADTPAHHFLESMTETPKMHRHGSGEAKIRAVQILNSESEPVDVVSFGEEVSFRFHIEYLEDVEESGLGFYLRDRYGNDILGINTFEEKQDLGPRKKGDRLIVEFRLSLSLRPGSYSVSPGLSYHRSEPRYLDWIDNALFFQVDQPSSGRYVYGFMHVQNQVNIQLIKKS